MVRCRNSYTTYNSCLLIYIYRPILPDSLHDLPQYRLAGAFPERTASHLLSGSTICGTAVTPRNDGHCSHFSFTRRHVGLCGVFLARVGCALGLVPPQTPAGEAQISNLGWGFYVLDWDDGGFGPTCRALMSFITD